MSKARSKLINYSSREFRQVRGFTTEVHFGKQEKHLPGRPGHDTTKSLLSIGIEEIQRLIEEKAGTGRWQAKSNREVVDFRKVIGQYRPIGGGDPIETTRGTIHYSKTGAHLVPASPKPKKRGL